MTNSESDMLQHNKLDGFFTEALMRNKPNWDMETIRTAALICSNALLLNNGYPAFQKTSDWVDAFLDEIGREVSVMGLHNYGFSTTAQKYLVKKGKQLSAYIEQEKQHASATPDGGVEEG